MYSELYTIGSVLWGEVLIATQKAKQTNKNEVIINSRGNESFTRKEI